MTDADDPPDDETESLDPPALAPSVDAATPEGMRRQERKADRDKRETVEFWRRIFADPIGRREMWALLFGPDSTHAFNPDFPVSPVGFPDPNAAWYRRGEQDFGLRQYHRWLALCPEGVMLMHREHDARFAEKPTRRARKKQD